MPKLAPQEAPSLHRVPSIEITRSLAEGEAIIDFKRKDFLAKGSQGRVYKVPVQMGTEVRWCVLKEMFSESCSQAAASGAGSDGKAGACIEKHLNLALTKADKSSRDHHIIKLIAHVNYENQDYMLYPFSELILSNLFNTQQGNKINNLQEADPNLHLAFCIQLALDLLKALQHMHDNKIVHRDIKPQNIGWHLGKWCLLDLGTAEHALELSESDQPTELSGTILYLHPNSLIENWFSRTRNNDIYALGQTLHCLMSKAFYDELMSYSFNNYWWKEYGRADDAKSKPQKAKSAIWDDYKAKKFGTLSEEILYIIMRMKSLNPLAQPSTQELIDVFQDLKLRLSKIFQTEGCSLEKKLTNLYSELIQEHPGEKRISEASSGLTFFSSRTISGPSLVPLDESVGCCCIQ